MESRTSPPEQAQRLYAGMGMWWEGGVVLQEMALSDSEKVLCCNSMDGS